MLRDAGSCSPIVSRTMLSEVTKAVHMDSPKSALVRPCRSVWHPKGPEGPTVSQPMRQALIRARLPGRKTDGLRCQGTQHPCTGLPLRPLGSWTWQWSSLPLPGQRPSRSWCCRRAKVHRAHSPVAPHPACPPQTATPTHPPAHLLLVERLAGLFCWKQSGSGWAPHLLPPGEGRSDPYQ